MNRLVSELTAVKPSTRITPMIVWSLESLDPPGPAPPWYVATRSDMEPQTAHVVAGIRELGIPSMREAASLGVLIDGAESGKGHGVHATIPCALVLEGSVARGVWYVQQEVARLGSGGGAYGEYYRAFAEAFLAKFS